MSFTSYKEQAPIKSRGFLVKFFVRHLHDFIKL